MLDEWVYQPGLPDNAARPDPAAFAAVDGALRSLCRRGRRRAASPIAGWTTAERLRFVNGLPRELPQDAARRARRAPSGCRRAAMRRCCSPGCSSRSPTATSRRCRRPSASSPRWAGASSSCRCSRPCSREGEWGRPIAERIYAPHPARLPQRDLDRGRPGAARRQVDEKQPFRENISIAPAGAPNSGPNLTIHQSSCG